ncbi:MAG: hypothetical protein HYV08_10455 [Deltaproteobacteria bacterium]|nr:hypothetical protein [Deltaproteobacteria bacterium]MBI3076027.1 hypothetical protein [Deltaproteobacteria bacterium]
MGFLIFVGIVVLAYGLLAVYRPVALAHVAQWWNRALILLDDQRMLQHRYAVGTVFIILAVILFGMAYRLRAYGVRDLVGLYFCR